MMSHEIIYIIVPKNKGSLVLKEAKTLGIQRGTIIKAKGTVKSRLLNFLTLYDIDKDLVMMGADRELSNKVSKELSEKFEFDKIGKGILFTIGVEVFFDNYGHVINEEYLDNSNAVNFEEENNLKIDEGSNQIVSTDYNNDRSDSMYKMITTIVEAGKAQDAVEIANEAGAQGATVLHGRGSGTEETLKLFNMEIEPEKEILLILAKKEECKPIIDALNLNLKLDEPGHGILFVQDINQAYGLYDDELDK